MLSLFLGRHTALLLAPLVGWVFFVLVCDENAMKLCWWDGRDGRDGWDGWGLLLGDAIASKKNRTKWKMLMISSFDDAGIKCIIMMMVMIMMQMQGKDYIALLSLDGTLAIFEQESHSFSRCHPHHHHRLRTARVHILYSFKADTFLTSESLQCDQIFSCYLGQLVCCEIEQ